MCTGSENHDKCKQVPAVESEQRMDQHYGPHEEELLEEVYTYRVNSGSPKSPTADIEINSILTNLHLDTQADVMVITEKHYKAMQAQCCLTSTKVVIRGYSSEGKGLALPLLGKFDAMLRKGDKQRAETVYVVKGQGDIVLLSREVAKHMPPLLMGENRLEVAEIMREYKDVFGVLESLKA